MATSLQRRFKTQGRYRIEVDRRFNRVYENTMTYPSKYHMVKTMLEGEAQKDWYFFLRNPGTSGATLTYSTLVASSAEVTNYVSSTRVPWTPSLTYNPGTYRYGPKVSNFGSPVAINFEASALLRGLAIVDVETKGDTVGPGIVLSATDFSLITLSNPSIVRVEYEFQIDATP